MFSSILTVLYKYRHNASVYSLIRRKQITLTRIALSIYVFKKPLEPDTMNKSDIQNDSPMTDTGNNYVQSTCAV